MTSEKLDIAIQLIEAGNKQAAVPVLRELIQENAGNENAWLLLYDCMDQVEHKKFCLQSALAINPANQEAREALAALNEPVSAPTVFAQPKNIEPLEEQQATAAPATMKWDEPVFEMADSKSVEPEKTDWDQAEAEEIVWERAQPQPEKMEWEQSDLEFLEQERIEREKVKNQQVEREKADSQKKEPPEIKWDEWDQVEPVSARPLKQKPVKALAQTTPRRKPRSKQRSLFPVLAGMVLFIMLFTVCLVFLAQLLVPIP